MFNISPCFQLLVALFYRFCNLLVKLELPFPAGWPRLDWQCSGLFCKFLGIKEGVEMDPSLSYIVFGFMLWKSGKMDKTLCVELSLTFSKHALDYF